MATPSSARCARLRGLTYSISTRPPASISSSGIGGKTPALDRISISRSMSGPRNSDCWRPIVGASRAPFSWARSMASVAVICGASTRIWNRVTRKASLIVLRRCSIMSRPISTRAPVCSGWTTCWPWSLTPPKFSAPGRRSKACRAPSSCSSNGGSMTLWAARMTVLDISLTILMSGRAVMAGERP